MNIDATDVMMTVAAQRRFERDILRREVRLLRAYTIARGNREVTMYFWNQFSPQLRSKQ